MRPIPAITALAAATIVCSCAPSNPQQAPQSNHARVVGGYAAHEVDATVQAHAAFAVSQRPPADSATLIRVTAAEQQVVAGTNYRITMVVRRNGTEERVQAVVWAKLDGTTQVTAWNVLP